MTEKIYRINESQINAISSSGANLTILRILSDVCENYISEPAAQEREDVLDEPHINQYLERIRKSSVALKDERLKTVISVALSIAADHYESLHPEVRK